MKINEFTKEHVFQVGEVVRVQSNKIIGNRDIPTYKDATVVHFYYDCVTDRVSYMVRITGTGFSEILPASKVRGK